MPKKSSAAAGQFDLFPRNEDERLRPKLVQGHELAPASSLLQEVEKQGKADRLRVVLSGTYRRDPAGLKAAHEELQDLGTQVLSPRHIDIASEKDGFVFMRGEETESPRAIEEGHLDAIKRADFVWLHTPDGYVGLSASLEVGFARAIAVPVFAAARPSDPVIAEFVRVVSGPSEVRSALRENSLERLPAASVTSFQNYYRRVAVERGYERESAKDCLVLMLEEFGELARAIRKRAKMVRHGKRGELPDEAAELADVFLYVAHMANILDVDLGSAVYAKERINLERFMRR